MGMEMVSLLSSWGNHILEGCWHGKPSVLCTSCQGQAWGCSSRFGWHIPIWDASPLCQHYFFMPYRQTCHGLEERIGRNGRGLLLSGARVGRGRRSWRTRRSRRRTRSSCPGPSCSPACAWEGGQIWTRLPHCPTHPSSIPVPSRRGGQEGQGSSGLHKPHERAPWAEMLLAEPGAGRGRIHACSGAEGCPELCTSPQCRDRLSKLWFSGKVLWASNPEPCPMAVPQYCRT